MQQMSSVPDVLCKLLCKEESSNLRTKAVSGSKGECVDQQKHSFDEDRSQIHTTWCAYTSHQSVDGTTLKGDQLRSSTQRKKSQERGTLLHFCMSLLIISEQQS